MIVIEVIALICALIFLVGWIALGVLLHTKDMLDGERERFFSRIPFTQAWTSRRLRTVTRTRYRDRERRIWITVESDRYPWETDDAPTVQLAARVRKAVHGFATIYED